MTIPIHPTPFALASNGELFINISGLSDPTHRAQGTGGAPEQEEVTFLGAPLTPEEREFVRARLENAALEAAAWVLGKRGRPAAPGNEADAAPEGEVSAAAGEEGELAR